MPTDPIGHVAMLQARAAAAVAHQPHLAFKILGNRKKVSISPPRPEISPPRKKPEGEAPIPRQILNRVLRAVSVAWECDPDTILGIWKPHRIIRPKFATYRLFQANTNLTWQALADYLERDRGSVREGLAKALSWYLSDPDWRDKFDRAAILFSAERSASPPLPRSADAPDGHPKAVRRTDSGGAS